MSLLSDKQRLSEWGQLIQADVLQQPPTVSDPAAEAVVGKFIDGLDALLREMQTATEGLK